MYGWTAGGKIYLNRDAMNPDAPIHEYTHLWDEMLRKRNPALWLRGKELLKRTSLWQEVLDDANYADIRADEDAVASEVHSRLTGREGAKLLAGILADGRIKPMERAGVLSQVKAWITDMYRELRGTFEKWSGRDLSKLSVEDFTRMTLRDLADGVNPRDYIVPERKATALNDGTLERPGANVGGGIEAEVDEHGVPFVKTEDGTTVFGEITEDSGLPVAPIKLSIGFQDNTTQKGYGLIHIEAKHGKQIREVGFKAVEEFVSYVAKNYDPNNIRVGKSREDGTGTYLIQVVDSHENTLYIELAKDGSYWSVNSGGVFRKGYANKKETVAKTEPQQPNNAVSSGSSLSKDEQSGTSSIEPNGEPTVSYRKDNNYASDKQENSAESLSYNLERRASDVYAMGVRMGVRVVVDRTLGSRGAYNPKTGEVRVNPDAHKSMADLERTMAHEVVGHKGIHSLLGKSFDKVCERVSHLIDSEADKALGSLFRNWGTMSRRERGAEYMAWLAEKGGENTNPGKWQRVCGYVRVAMRRMGFGFEVTDADVRYMLYVSAKRATKAGGGQPIRRPEL